jgi:hypothetical protein
MLRKDLGTSSTKVPNLLMDLFLKELKFAYRLPQHAGAKVSCGLTTTMVASFRTTSNDQPPLLWDPPLSYLVFLDLLTA